VAEIAVSMAREFGKEPGEVERDVAELIRQFSALRLLESE